MKYFCEVEVYQRTTAADWAIRIIGVIGIVVALLASYYHWELI